MDLGDSFNNVPGGTANWVFTDASGSVEIVINKTDASIVVEGAGLRR